MNHSTNSNSLPHATAEAKHSIRLCRVPFLPTTHPPRTRFLHNPVRLLFLPIPTTSTHPYRDAVLLLARGKLDDELGSGPFLAVVQRPETAHHLDAILGRNFSIARHFYRKLLSQRCSRSLTHSLTSLLYTTAAPHARCLGWLSTAKRERTVVSVVSPFRLSRFGVFLLLLVYVLFFL